MIHRFFIILIITVLLCFKHYGADHFFDGYSSAYPLNAVAGKIKTVEGTVETFGQTLHTHYRRQRIEFDSQPGERVPALLTLPVEAKEPIPVIILLHGSHQNKTFVKEICTPFNEAGFAMICYDQYMCGERKVSGGVLKTMKDHRDRLRKTVHDTQRLIDYLATRKDIDSRRVYLTGISYGAIAGTVAVARDNRIRAAAMVAGGGNFRLLAKSPEIREVLPKWLWPLAWPLIELIAGPADPIHHAAQTAGTPFLMLNGSEDDIVTPEAARALYKALGEPKEIRWYPINHPNLEPNGKEVIKMLDDGLKWFQEQDASTRKE